MVQFGEDLVRPKMATMKERGIGVSEEESIHYNP
jgi:hypothetical protein